MGLLSEHSHVQSQHASHLLPACIPDILGDDDRHIRVSGEITWSSYRSFDLLSYQVLLGQ